MRTGEFPVCCSAVMFRNAGDISWALSIVVGLGVRETHFIFFFFKQWT